MSEEPGELPLAYDLLRQLETPTNARLDPNSFWGFNSDEPLPELSIEEIGQQLGPLMEYSQPDQHSERVQFYDVTRRTAQGLGEGVFTMELVRQAIPVESVAVIQRIGTWLRLTAQNAGGQNVVFELYDGVPGLNATAVGTPFPFPFQHPNGGTLDVEFTLIRERIPDAGRAQPPAFVALAAPNVIPYDTPIISPWRDMRYMWNATFAESLYFVTGDRCLLRLFATITIVGQRWGVEIAGRLGGHFNVTGYRKAALDHAIFRH